MELLIHINRRVKTRPQVQLPVEALLLQYQDPAASSFVIVCYFYLYVYFNEKIIDRYNIIITILFSEFYNYIYKIGISTYGNEKASRINTQCIKCY